MSNKNILILIREIYDTFTRSERKIADFISTNMTATQFMSITSLADECNVGDATITRFCKKLGYHSYNEFKLAVAKYGVIANNSLDTEVQFQILDTDSIEDMTKKLYNINTYALKSTVAVLDSDAITNAVHLFNHSNRIFCLGQGGSSIIAKEAWARFTSASTKFQCIEDSHMQAMAASITSSNDVILYFSYSGATIDSTETLKLAKNAGAKIVLITHFKKCPAAAYADIIIICGGEENPILAGSISAKMDQLFIIDILFHEYCRQNNNRCTYNIEQTTNALSHKHL